MTRPRIIALLATYNEERFIDGCLSHLTQQGIEAYLIDNESTDRTVDIARRYLGTGLIEIETFPHRGVYPWTALLERKAQLAATLDADWFLHLDADEIRPSPIPGATLAEALAGVDDAGYNAVNFQEFTFVPTRESPDHDHKDYLRTMRWYYPFLPRPRHQVKAWKRQPVPVDLASAGHRVEFTDLRIYPEPFPMRHYLFLSVEHAIRKYVLRQYDEREVAWGWHGGRPKLTEGDIVLSSQSELREYRSDAELDSAAPLKHHPLFAPMEVSP